MKKELKESRVRAVEVIMKPFVNSLVDAVLQIEQQAIDREEKAQAQLERNKKEADNLKAQRQDNERHLELSKDKLNQSLEKENELAKQLESEIIKQKKCNIALEDNKEKISATLSEATINKDITVKSLNKAKEKMSESLKRIAKAEYIEKINDKKTSELQLIEAALIKKEKALLKKEVELTDKETRLNDLDLTIKIERKEIERLIKRNDLKKKIKEK